jgi:hypothetical protein
LLAGKAHAVKMVVSFLFGFSSALAPGSRWLGAPTKYRMLPSVTVRKTFSFMQLARCGAVPSGRVCQAGDEFQAGQRLHG